MSDLARAFRLEKKLSAAPGVSYAGVNIETERATVHYDSRWVTIPQLVRSVEESGGGVAAVRTTLAVQGLSCASRVSDIERALREAPGVLSANVNPATGRATVESLPGLSGDSDLRAAIKLAGYSALEAPEAELADREEEARNREARSLSAGFILSGALSVLILLGGLEGLSTLAPQRLPSVYIVWLLATLVQFYTGRAFYRGAWAAARRWGADGNTLIALGTSTVYFYSAAAVLFPDFLRGIGDEPRPHFDAAAIMTTLILLGRRLEVAARGRARAAVKNLRGLRPKAARIFHDGREWDIPADQVRIGSRTLVDPGNRVPADGVIVEGGSSLDESGGAGGRLPVNKGVGDKVFAGALNITDRFLFEVRAAGAETALARTAKRVESAQGRPAPIQGTADRPAAVFVPAVIGTALITFTLWLLLGPAPAFHPALLSFAAVVIVASPCALAFATPSAVQVGTGRGAESGILIRGGEALEAASGIQTVIIEKTGVLTEGRPEVTDLITAHGFSAEEVLRLAGAAERQSGHPLGIAIIEKARERGAPLTAAEGFSAVAGRGVRAAVEGRSILVGNAGLMEAEGVDISGLRNAIEVQTEKGKTPVLLAVDGVSAALLATADPLKESARETIERLHRMGLETVLLTGGHRRSAQVIGEEAGIGRVLAEVPPEDKAREILRLQGEGKRAAVVSSGFREAPIPADLGISIGTRPDGGGGAGVSDITLPGRDPMGVVNAIRLSRRTLRTVRQNLFWAFAYNAAAIPLAAGVLHPLFGTAPSPVIASLALAAGSAFVLWNSLRLRRFRPVEFKT
jgi:Cu+-exporting ATPase